MKFALRCSSTAIPQDGILVVTDVNGGTTSPPSWPPTDTVTTKAWVVTLHWMMSTVSVAIFAAFAARSAMKEEWLGLALFGLMAIAVTVSQIVWSRRIVREADSVRRSDPSSDSAPPLEDASLLCRLDEFGWNALPAYLAVLGAVFVVSGLAVGDLRNFAFGGVLVGLSIFKRRQEGAWYRRF